MVSTHSRLKAAGQVKIMFKVDVLVSTHSRLKAAGIENTVFVHIEQSFNTQPPEGGW